MDVDVEKRVAHLQRRAAQLAEEELNLRDARPRYRTPKLRRSAGSTSRTTRSRTRTASTATSSKAAAGAQSNINGPPQPAHLHSRPSLSHLSQSPFLARFVLVPPLLSYTRSIGAGARHFLVPSPSSARTRPASRVTHIPRRTRASSLSCTFSPSRTASVALAAYTHSASSSVSLPSRAARLASCTCAALAAVR
jgi:hypothetical protein